MDMFLAFVFIAAVVGFVAWKKGLFDKFLKPDDPKQ